jgi:hypothetical protein
MTATISIISLVCAVILFLLGLIEYFRTWSTKEKIAVAAGKAAGLAQETNASTEELEKHAGIDFKGQWEALAALATALKDLDRSTRLFVLSLAFLAVGGVTRGLEAIGTGLAAS